MLLRLPMQTSRSNCHWDVTGPFFIPKKSNPSVFNAQNLLQNRELAAKTLAAQEEPEAPRMGSSSSFFVLQSLGVTPRANKSLIKVTQEPWGWELALGAGEGNEVICSGGDWETPSCKSSLCLSVLLLSLAGRWERRSHWPK